MQSEILLGLEELPFWKFSLDVYPIYCADTSAKCWVHQQKVHQYLGHFLSCEIKSFLEMGLRHVGNVMSPGKSRSQRVNKLLYGCKISPIE